MRSEYVFAAMKEVHNRSLLCRITSASARSLHIDSRQPSETINKSLKLIAVGEMNSCGDDASDQSSPAPAPTAAGQS